MHFESLHKRSFRFRKCWKILRNNPKFNAMNDRVQGNVRTHHLKEGELKDNNNKNSNKKKSDDGTESNKDQYDNQNEEETQSVSSASVSPKENVGLKIQKYIQRNVFSVSVPLWQV
mmetsp:Transcript_12628/g.18140  ORF Transcript_12628/g.18140 Transcript_12628/m.18140 type:complete len:116 (-) Transcript_12628:321-668(-)